MCFGTTRRKRPVHYLVVSADHGYHATMTRERNQLRRPNAVPINPGVRQLVNRMNLSDPVDVDAMAKGFHGWHERGYLPHRDEPGLVQFVTFCLFDSLSDLSEGEREDGEIDAALDQGHGGAYLRNPAVAECVESALIHFHEDRYKLRAWCVMPNHVHALFETMNTPMRRVVESWKKYTAPRANRLLDRRGRFWEAEYWDTFMRDAEHERETMRYIEENPVKAGLVTRARDWPWSSARRRDACGRLVIRGAG